MWFQLLPSSLVSSCRDISALLEKRKLADKVALGGDKDSLGTVSRLYFPRPRRSVPGAQANVLSPNTLHAEASLLA